MGNTISKSNPGSYRYVCPVINCFFTHLESTCNFPYRLSSVVSMCSVPQIYCAEMQTDFPKEYVTLRSGQTDNYSEVYGHRCVQCGDD